MTPQEWLKSRPSSVAVVALGQSRMEYGDHIICSTTPEMQQQSFADRWEQVWTINAGLRCYRHDAAFVMDDLRRLARQFPGYGRALLTHDRPIISSVAYPEFPMSLEFPLNDVLKVVGDDYFTNTVCYMLGYAMTIGVKEVFLYGADFFYPHLNQAQFREEGAMNTAYMLGMMRHFGMKYYLPESTTLLSAHTVKAVNGVLRRPLYGYEKDPREAVNVESSGSTQVRESAEHGAVPAKEDTAGAQSEAGGRAGDLCAERGAVLRGGPASDGDTGLVLGGGGTVEPASEARVRPDTAQGARSADGADIRLSADDYDKLARHYSQSKPLMDL